MLKTLFEWFDTHGQSYWIIAAVPTLLLLIWTAWGATREPDAKSSRRNELFFALLVLGVLLAWRWPFLLSADEYNPDESQLIAGAITLRVDPVPWRSVDGFTSGPLNFYPLLLPGLLGLPMDYFMARLVGLLLIWTALLACYRLFRSWYGPALARVGIIPALAFFSTVTDWDFIHYSSEHLSLFLVALSACCLLRARPNPADRERWQLVGCFIAGLLPWAKLQSAPLAATLVAIAFLAVWRDPTIPRPARTRAVLARLGAAGIPTVAILLVIFLSGQTPHFFRSYVLQNFNYVSNGASVGSTVRELWSTSRMTNHFTFFLVISSLAILAGSLRNRQAASSAPSRWVGVGLFVIAVLSILTPRRALFHYVLLSTIPLTLWLGITLGAWADIRGPRRAWLGLGVILVGLVPFGLRTTQPLPHMFGCFADHWRESRTILAKVVRSYAQPHSRMAIWGWLPSLFVESGLPQGTRDGNSSWAMIPSPHREYYMQRFLADLRHNAPDVFVDAVGFGSRFFPDRTQAGHESFPALAEYVREHYELVTDEGYARVYVKSGLQPTKPLITRETEERLPAAENPEEIEGLHRESITPADLPQAKMRNGHVQMMHPPAEIVWSLEPTTREILFEYGFAPEAYRNGHSDGAELIFELHSEGVPVRHLFYQLLDPVHRIADRGPTTSRLILPPFKPGARLVARTTVGQFGNGAWDWIYLGRVIPIASPTFTPAQFPHFNRVPDSADADLSYLLQEGGEQTLILHAPALLKYRLTGKERRVRFDYGFRVGAYSNGGQTDGAIFNVELEPKNGKAAQSVFQKQLTPTSKPEDRGSHSTDLQLPHVSEGDTLILRVDSGAGGAWDWTYVTNFVLE
jgi:hypothetical protein